MPIERILTIIAFLTAIGGGFWLVFDRVDFVDDLIESPPWTSAAEKVWVEEQLSAHLGAGHNVSGDISSALTGPQTDISNLKGAITQLTDTMIRLNDQLDILNDRLGEANVKIGILDTQIDSEITNVARLVDEVDELVDEVDELGDSIVEIGNRPWVRAPIAGQ